MAPFRSSEEEVVQGCFRTSVVVVVGEGEEKEVGCNEEGGIGGVCGTAPLAVFTGEGLDPNKAPGAVDKYEDEEVREEGRKKGLASFATTG